MNIVGFKRKVEDYVVDKHSRAPGLQKLPLSALVIIVALIVANALTWAAVGVVLVSLFSSYCSKVSYIDDTLQHYHG